MPEGPKGEKRPSDLFGNAEKFMPIAVGEKLTHHRREE
jgi:hypothetical protein